MSIGESEIHYPKKIFSSEDVRMNLVKFGMPEFWRVEETNKDFVAKFKPPKIKILKEFRK